MNFITFNPIFNINFCGKNERQPVFLGNKPDSCEFRHTNCISDDPELNNILLKCGKNLKEIVNNSMKNYINGGYTSDFYNITDKNGKETGYLLAISKEALKQLQDGTYIWQYKFRKVEDEYPGFNFGQCIAKANGMRIHRKIDGEPSGIIYNTKDDTPAARYDYISNCIFDSTQNAQYVEHIKRLRELSRNQQCFDGFAQKITEMSEKYMFDPFPNNVLVDIKNSRLNIIDPTTKENSITFQCHGNHLSGMLSSLFDPKYVKRQSAQARKAGNIPSDTNPEYVAVRKEVLKHCLIAAKKNNMSFEKNPYKKNSDNYKYCDLEYLFKIAGISKSQMTDVLELEKTEDIDKFSEFVKSL